MKRFRFQLQAVLTLRERAEQSAQVKWARCWAAVEAAAARLGLADQAIAALEQVRRRQLEGQTRAEELEHARVYSVLLQERRTELARELAQAKREAEQARQQMKLAAQRREAMEKLRVRRKRAHDYAAAVAEQKLLDERSARGSVLAGMARETNSNL